MDEYVTPKLGDTVLLWEQGNDAHEYSLFNGCSAFVCIIVGTPATLGVADDYLLNQLHGHSLAPVMHIRRPRQPTDTIKDGPQPGCFTLPYEIPVY